MEPPCATISSPVDPALRPQWDEQCAESFLYKQVSDTQELVYIHSQLPWPVTDRDMALYQASDASGWVTGTEHVIDGGLLIS